MHARVLVGAHANSHFPIADVDDIKFVVNYDYPGSSEDYVHRIGRTGRRDRKGTAYTFFTDANAKQANELIGVLTEAKQEVNPKLYELAQNSHRFGRNVRSRYGGGGSRFGGGGFGGRSNGYGGGAKRSYGESNGNGSSDYKRFKPSFNGASNGAGGGGSGQDRYSSY